MLYVPFASGIDAFSVPLLLCAMFCELTYRIIAVIGCSLSTALAWKLTGEPTVDPACGEQMATVLSVVAAHGTPLPTLYVMDCWKLPRLSQPLMTTLCVPLANVKTWSIRSSGVSNDSAPST